MLELLTNFLRKLTHWRFGGENAIEMQEKSVQFNTEDKRSNRRKVFTLEFHKKLLKVICEKTKSTHKSRFTVR